MAAMLGEFGSVYYLGARKLSTELGRRVRLSSPSSSNRVLKSRLSTSLVAGDCSMELELELWLLRLKVAWDWDSRSFCFFGRPEKNNCKSILAMQDVGHV